MFCCEAPYPVDMYVRISLRRRAWVEKFGSKVSNSNNSTSSGHANSKLTAETEEGMCTTSITLIVLQAWRPHVIAEAFWSSAFKASVITQCKSFVSKTCIKRQSACKHHLEF